MKGMSIGMSASQQRTFTDDERKRYLKLSGEPEQVDGSGRHLLPGSLIGGMFSYILGTDLPGFGTNYLKQKMSFPAPAYFGEKLTATVTIVRLRPDKNLVNLATKCVNERGELVCEGEALVLAKDVKPRELAHA